MDRIILVLKILVPILGAVISPVIAYLKYNSTREVAKGLIGIGNERFGIKISKWKTLPFCWEWSVFLSGISFCFSSCCRKDSDNEETICLLEEKNRKWKDLNLVETGDKNEFPSKAWKINNGSLDQDAVQEFNNMLDKCQNITYSNFLSHFQKYADSLFSKGRNSHEYHCRHDACKADGHSKFTNCIGCLEPLLHYVVFDWNYFCIIIKKKIEENTEVKS